ncbi:centrosomal protein of 68 kDa isoform X2 [Dunckerocampus dactyliophorus]|uniref:centrosomal protein of 68 kDa isoform X2 n=1 Tax=Dunckerocampus dactyliophorus TaxID=161453 RepID=UPI00240548B6|nr:centrosomal protein of 68 kDa isoform X2 [Dunckerocampus dactyliophorus]
MLLYCLLIGGSLHVAMVTQVPLVNSRLHVTTQTIFFKTCKHLNRFLGGGCHCRTLLFSLMDTSEGGLPWKADVPQMRPRKPLRQTTEDIAGGKGAKEWATLNRNVTMAPTSRCLTDRRYVIRKPLFSVQQPSILKKTHQIKHPEKEKYISDNMTDEGCCSPLLISDLSGCVEHEDPSAGPAFPRRPIECRLSSSILEIQKIERPVRLQLTSTVLNPPHTPRSTSYSKRRQTESNRRSLSRQAMSSYEANYWDCAIPKSLHPTPNRQTAAWDPNREYQALLDYTYPLRPGPVDNELDSFDLQGDSFQQQDPTLQDSGVELDSLCRSTSLSGLDLSQSSNRWTKVWEMQSGDQTISSSGQHSRTYSGEVSYDTFGTGKDGVSCHQNGGQLQCSQPSSSIAFIRTTSVLPQSRCVDEDLDKEFLSLPDHLEELQFLSRKVKEVTAVLDTTRTPETKQAKEVEESNQDDGKENMNVDVTESVRGSSRSWMETVGGVTHGNIQEVEALVEQLCGFSLRDTERTMPVDQDQDQDSSLVQHIHVFSSLLQRHIRWLHVLSDKTDVSAAPADGVSRSLAEYQKFQREVSGHQPLISRVLHTGEQLLSYMDATSPVLANTLMLIERRSGALKNHTRRFLSSVQSAVDNLTQPTQPV